MSIIAERVETTSMIERHENRYTGLLIAVGASLVIWSGIGAGVWGLVSLFN